MPSAKSSRTRPWVSALLEREHDYPVEALLPHARQSGVRDPLPEHHGEVGGLLWHFLPPLQDVEPPAHMEMEELLALSTQGKMTCDLAVCHCGLEV